MGLGSFLCDGDLWTKKTFVWVVAPSLTVIPKNSDLIIILHRTWLKKGCNCQCGRGAVPNSHMTTITTLAAGGTGSKGITIGMETS